jgi:large subunit ribosomal protein L9
MKVLLTKDVKGLGKSGDVKEVSDGHARNFLIPKHLALPATSSVLAQVQKEEQERQLKIVRDIERFMKIKGKLENKTITIKAKASKSILFAGLHEKEIAHAIGENLGIEVSPDFIILPGPIKSVGVHEVKIRFAKDQEALVKLDVIAEQA